MGGSGDTILDFPMGWQRRLWAGLGLAQPAAEARPSIKYYVPGIYSWSRVAGTVRLVEIDRRAGVAPGRHTIERAGKFDPQGAGPYGVTIRPIAGLQDLPQILAGIDNMTVS